MNSRGRDLSISRERAVLVQSLRAVDEAALTAAPLVSGELRVGRPGEPVTDPADRS